MSVEDEAMKIAKAHFVKLGYHIEKNIQGCDFIAVKDDKKLYVEVKGRKVKLPHITLSRKEAELFKANRDSFIICEVYFKKPNQYQIFVYGKDDILKVEPYVTIRVFPNRGEP